jgi:hypothetical protein
VTAVAAVPATAEAAQAWHVFAPGSRPGAAAAAVAAVLDPGFLAEAGWDPVRLVLSPPAAHPLLGRPVCQAAGCGTTAPQHSRICASCQRRLTERGLSPADVALLPARPYPVRGPGACAVAGCARERVSAPAGLCGTHLDLRRALGISTDEFLRHPAARPLPACGPCAVAACPRQRRHRDGQYCDAHQMRLRAIRKSDPALDEHYWRRTSTAIGCGGQVSLRGLPPLVIAEVLAGLQQRCRVNAVKTREAELRAVCDDLRRQQAASIEDYVLADDRSLAFKGLVNCLAGHARRALATPETEVRKDQWDLVLFGHRGTVDFTGITQIWLRETTKRWAADDLPRRRINPAGSPAAAARSVTTSAAWRGCRSRCGCGPAVASIPQCWAAPTWKRSCTGSRSCTRPGGSPPMPGSGPAARSGMCSPGPA